jgi:hypothetical protein
MREREREIAGARSGVRPILDQQGENDREQNGEKQPSFHGGNSGTRVRRVNSGSPASGSVVSENGRRENATLRPLTVEWI